MKLGVCAGPEKDKILSMTGFDFLELHVQNHLVTLEDDVAFDGALASIQSSTLPCPVANCFVPGNLKITGDDVDMTALEDYVTIALTRAQKAGIDTIVFGSGGARRIPEGFNRDLAWDQLVDFGKMVGPIALKNDVTVVVEPLNLKECNVLTSVGESGRYVEAVDHSAVRLLVDTYHWGVDNDSVDDIVKYSHLVCHVHIATFPSRKPPGIESCDFSSIFSALESSNYGGRVSVEARWDDMAKQAQSVYDALVDITSN